MLSTNIYIVSDPRGRPCILLDVQNSRISSILKLVLQALTLKFTGDLSSANCKMKASLTFFILGLAAGSLAAPAPVPVEQADRLAGLQELQARQLSNTENDIVDDSPCKALTIIFARGTTESGNVGTLAGPPFFQALYADLGSSKVALQGVDYPANIQGFLEGGDPSGSQTMANLVSQV